MTPSFIRITMLETFRRNPRRRVLRIKDSGIIYEMFRVSSGYVFRVRPEAMRTKRA